MRLTVVPLTLDQANAMVAKFHRHHKPVQGHRFSIGCVAAHGLRGAVVVGRPVARMTEQYATAEVARLVTDGTKNACSILYAAAARAAQAMGFRVIQTFILDSELGTSLKAAGWQNGGTTDGGTWNRPSRGGRREDQPRQPKQRWFKELNPPRGAHE